MPVAVSGPRLFTPSHNCSRQACGQRRRSRVQHEAEPYPGDDDDAACVAAPEVNKRFRDASDIPSGYPVMGQVSAGAFRRGPITGDHAACTPGYAGFASDAQRVPVPSAAMNAAAVCRPLLTDGRARPAVDG